MPDVPPFGRFFLPGPTEVRPEIAGAQLRPMIGHRGPEMEALLARVQPTLQSLFGTTRPVYISTSSATGMMEGAIRNGARAKVLSLVNGAFSERFFQIALSCGLEAEKLEVPMGAGHTPEQLEAALRAGDFDAVTVVHSETSTGVLNPIHELSRIVRAAGDVVLLVDSVSGVGSTPVETDAWKLDFILTGSQKALALPPGLAFGVAGPRLLERAAQNTRRGVYFDFLEFEKGARKHQTPNTPAVSLLYALDAQMERLREESVAGRCARHQAMAERTWTWVDELHSRGVPLSVLAPEGFRSASVTCIRLPDGTKGSSVAAAMEARGYTIAPGYGPLRDATIRIGHMGDHTVAELDVLLAELASELGA